MPELPEVQTIINDLVEEGIVGRTIQHVHVFWHKTVATPQLDTFIHELTGLKILSITRRGKYLVFQLSNKKVLLVHLRMTGRLLLVDKGTPLTPYVRLVLDLDHRKELHYHDTRKFGRWYLVQDSLDILHKMGPEPLDAQFTQLQFKALLKGKKRALKPLLLDQTFIAGLGNIYVDEALWEAKLHPSKRADTLCSKEIEHLHQGIIHVLQRGIDSQGTTLGKGRTNYYRLKGQQGSHQTLLNVFRRTGDPCPRCGKTIERIVVAQRSTHFCPGCQHLP